LNNQFNYIFRFANLNDIPDLLRLIKSQYNKVFNEEYFIWQYFSSYTKTVLSCAFTFDGHLIGMFGLQKKYLSTGIIGAQAIDLLIDNEYRGKGIFKAMGKRAINEINKIDFLFVLPNSNGQKAIENSFGWNTIAKIPALELPLNNFDINSNIVLQKEVLARRFQYFKCDKEYEYWRFENHPIYKYTKIAIKQDVFAYVKIYFDTANLINYGDIAYYTLSDDIHVNIELLKKVLFFFLNNKVSMVTTWALKKTPFYNILINMGFETIQKERYFCCHLLNEKINKDYFYNGLNWHLMPSDTEMY
jgi:hypothetical protein